MGGCGNVSNKYGSFAIVLQCLLSIPDIEGSLGSYVIAKTGLWDTLLFVTLFNASDLGTCLALFKAASINFGL